MLVALYKLKFQYFLSVVINKDTQRFLGVSYLILYSSDLFFKYRFLSCHAHFDFKSDANWLVSFFMKSNQIRGICKALIENMVLIQRYYHLQNCRKLEVKQWKTQAQIKVNRAKSSNSLLLLLLDSKY